jgi:prephenate dehydrogenase
MDVLIVGLGLMGGSIAKALRAWPEAGRIDGADTDPATMAAARADGAVDGEGDLDGLPYGLVVLCVYPSGIASFLRTFGPRLRPGTLVTDIAGVKSWLMSEIDGLVPAGIAYVGGHPMAGSEQSGYAHSDPSMFRGANYLLTPTAASSEADVATLSRMAKAIGCRKVTVCDAQTHDRMVAFVSELPHAIAAAVGGSRLMERAADYTGNSLRDVTRVARFNASLWSELFLENRAFIVPEIERFAADLERLRGAIEAGDREAVEAILKACRRLDA